MTLIEMVGFAVSTVSMTLIGMIGFVVSTVSMTLIGLIGFVAFTTTTISTTSLFSITSVFRSSHSFNPLPSFCSLRSSTYLLAPYPYGDCGSYGYGAYHRDYSGRSNGLLMCFFGQVQE